MKLDITERGLAIATFTDRLGNDCSIQESSTANIDAIWLGIDNNRMFLDQKLGGELLELLTIFVETGRLQNDY